MRLTASPLCSPCVSREHHDGFLHVGLDGGLHRGVRGLQLHHSGTQDPHARNARARQRYGILTASVTKITPTCGTHVPRRSRWVRVQVQGPSLILTISNQRTMSSKVKNKTDEAFNVCVFLYEDQNVRTFWGSEERAACPRVTMVEGQG